MSSRDLYGDGQGFRDTWSRARRPMANLDPAMSSREKAIEEIRVALDPSMEGIVRECFRIVEDTIRDRLPHGTFSDEPQP